MRQPPLFPIEAPIWMRSGLSKIIFAVTVGIRPMINVHKVTLLLVAASAPALKQLPGGASQSNGAIVPLDIGRSWNG
jgi:hypothetical protein